MYKDLKIFRSNCALIPQKGNDMNKGKWRVCNVSQETTNGIESKRKLKKITMLNSAKVLILIYIGLLYIIVKSSQSFKN